MNEVERKQRIKEAYEEANRTQNIHFIGLGKDMKEVYHRQRFCTPLQADKMAAFQAGTKGISCVNILTDEEYEKYRAQKKETAKRSKSSWRVSKSKSNV